MAMRNSIGSPAGWFAFSVPIASWTATAHCTASTALGKSAIDAVAGGIEYPTSIRSDHSGLFYV